MGSLIISISKTKKISTGLNITTSPSQAEEKDDYQKNDLHISAFKFTEEMLEMLKTKVKSRQKKAKINNIVVIDFIFDEAPEFSIELFNRFSEITKLKIVLVILNQEAFKQFNEFKSKIKFEGLVFQFDFPLVKNSVDVDEVSLLNGVFYKTANVYERKRMEYEDK